MIFIIMSSYNFCYKTPLLRSSSLEEACGVPAYLKMENIQPSGSFKIRGISNLVIKSLNDGITKLVSSSGGNAGMATAHVGRVLGIPTTVVIPESTPMFMKKMLENEGANVEIFGSVWNEAHNKALELSDVDSVLYVHPYDHPLIWDGVSSIVDEIVEKCPLPISAIVLSVGGGGLLCGVLQGLQRCGLKIPVVAMETDGASCFNTALKHGKPVMLEKITSIAKTLGALKVTSKVFDILPHSNVLSEVVADKEAVNACIHFLNDSRCLVEPSCGAALSAGYSKIINRLINQGKISKDGAVVFIICGGNVVNMDLLNQWKDDFGL